MVFRVPSRCRDADARTLGLRRCDVMQHGRDGRLGDSIELYFGQINCAVTWQDP